MRDSFPHNPQKVQDRKKLKKTVENLPKNSAVVTVKEIKDLRQTFEIETGYGDVNAWVEWIKYTVQSLNCYACASGRPIAQVVPFPLGWTRDPQGMRCMIALYQEETAWGDEACKSLSLLFPSMVDTNVKIPPAFSTAVGNHTACLSRQGVKVTRPIGNFSLCREILNVTEDSAGNFSRLGVPRADLWWYWGGKILRSTLPPSWGGTCALVQLAIPFALAFEKGMSQIPRRTKRSLGVSFDDPIYVDSIGVPRGVPDEFKARNQIAAGFESLLWWVTINKNLDWINYIYCNQQRFINYKGCNKGNCRTVRCHE